jgi:hypothetical protein
MRHIVPDRACAMRGARRNRHKSANKTKGGRVRGRPSPIRLPTPSLIIGTDCDRRLIGPEPGRQSAGAHAPWPLVLYPAIKLEIRVSRQNPLQCSPMHVETSRSFRFLIHSAGPGARGRRSPSGCRHTARRPAWGCGASRFGSATAWCAPSDQHRLPRPLPPLPFMNACGRHRPYIVRSR